MVAVAGWVICADERLELGPQQLGVRADQLGEHRWGVDGQCLDGQRIDGCGVKVLRCRLGERGKISHVVHLPVSRSGEIRSSGFRR